MNINSNLFFKAIDTIAKQTSSAQAPVTEKKAFLERLSNLDQGTSIWNLLSYLTPVPCSSYFPAIPANLIGDMDKGVLQRARDLLADTTMAEIMNEDPEGPTSFHTALRQQIVALCVRLRISLILINKLMAISVAIAQETPK